MDDRKVLCGILFVLYIAIPSEFLPQELGFVSLSRLAPPGRSATSTTFDARALSTGATACLCSGAPATINVSSPRRAGPGLPRNGASTIDTPRRRRGRDDLRHVGTDGHALQHDRVRFKARGDLVEDLDHRIRVEHGDEDDLGRSHRFGHGREDQRAVTLERPGP